MLEQCGAFSVVLEKFLQHLPKSIRATHHSNCRYWSRPDADGQILVVHDMLGINKEFKPRFLRRYADLDTIMHEAIGQYVADVKAVDFPNAKESY
jgi:3-methyl-2-oxobutanoate hydroxymethyltransferase